MTALAERVQVERLLWDASSPLAHDRLAPVDAITREYAGVARATIRAARSQGAGSWLHAPLSVLSRVQPEDARGMFCQRLAIPQPCSCPPQPLGATHGECGEAWRVTQICPGCRKQGKVVELTQSVRHGATCKDKRVCGGLPGRRHFRVLNVLERVVQEATGRRPIREPEGQVARLPGRRGPHVPRGDLFFEHEGSAYLIDVTVVDSTAATYRWDRSSWRIGSDWQEGSALRAAHATKLASYGRPVDLGALGVRIGDEDK